LDVRGGQSTYTQLFLTKALKNTNAAFQPDVFGDFFLTSVPLMSSGQYNPILLSAFQLQSTQLDTLIHYLGIPDPAGFNISLQSIGVFYGYVTLCKVWDISLTDLLNLITAFGKPDVLRKWDVPNNQFTKANVLSGLSFIRFVEGLSESNFNLSELLFVLGMGDDNVIAGQITEEGIKNALISLQQSLMQIDQQNPAPKDSEIDQSYLKSKLLSLY
jgi:hypothetical protein